MRPTSIRIRLTLWYIAIFGLVIGLYVCAAGAIEYWELNDQLYRAEVQDIETVEGLLYFNSGGRLLLNEDYHSARPHRLLLQRFMQVLDPNGKVLFRNERLNGDDLGGAPLAQEAMASHYARRFRLADGTHVLTLGHFHPVQGRRVLIRIAYSTEPLRRDTLEMMAILLLALPLALVAAGLTGYRIAGKALTPLSAMATFSEQITARQLNSRIQVQNPDDELGHMARVLNALLEQLEVSYQKLQHFTSNVSHELRTPMTSIRSIGEVGLQRNHSGEEYREIIGSMLEEVVSLTSMIETLFTIAQADSRGMELNRTIFPMMEIVEESVEVVGVLAEEKKQSIVVIGDGALLVSADRGFLRMAVINLIDNSVKYSPPGSSIHVELKLVNGEGVKSRYVNLAVKDEGPGIPPIEADSIFDRFYRLDESLVRAAGGAGLGLAIAKWSVETHGGQILLDSNPGSGSSFNIRLPVA